MTPENIESINEPRPELQQIPSETYLKQTEENWITFSFGIVAAITALLYGVLPLISWLLTPESQEPVDYTAISETGMILSLVMSQLPVIVLLLILAVIFYRTIPIATKFRFTNWRWQYLLLPFAIEVVLLPIIYIVTIIFHFISLTFFDTELPPRDLQMFLLHCSPPTLCFMAVGAVIIAPIIEELMFRKVIFDYLARFFQRVFASSICCLFRETGGLSLFFEKHTGVIISTLITSALFSAVHYTLIQSPALFLIGLTLQLLYIFNKSIYPSILLHIVHNGTAFLLLIIMRMLMENEFFKTLIEQGS